MDWQAVRSQFMLAPDEIYLNAGTFSAMPRPVYEALIRHIAAGEANPTRVAVLASRKPLWAVQGQIARYVGAEPEDILFHVNVTQALNQALFCLHWPQRGEFLISDQEYGAIVNAAREMARRRGLSVRVFALPLRPRSADELVEAVLGAVSSETVGVLISHVTCATGIVVPIERIAPALRARNIRLIVDGAHGPGLLALNLGATEVDVYGGNLHKWFMGPKGTAFLYVARRLHTEMSPHIVGWGGVSLEPQPVHWKNDKGTRYRFQYVFQTQGLYDASPYLALTAALEFRAGIGEERIRGRIAELNAFARRRIGQGLGLEILSPAPELNAGLLAFRAPQGWLPDELEHALYDRFRITVPAWRAGPDTPIFRVSPHIWNVEEHIERLAEALVQLRR